MQAVKPYFVVAINIPAKLTTTAMISMITHTAKGRADNPLAATPTDVKRARLMPNSTKVIPSKNII
tara:strand:- start:226 stop:423 length:198 start_codon:yes stop_codon:yes gene_type:complete